MEPGFSPQVQYLSAAPTIEFTGSNFLFNLLSYQSALFFVFGSLFFEDTLPATHGALEFSLWSRNGSGFIE